MLQQVKTKIAGAARRLLRFEAVRRLARREDGVVAVEFAIVVTPFLGLLFAILETSLIFFADQNLERVTGDAARLIMTGQQQGATTDASCTSDPSPAFCTFKKAVCNDLTAHAPMFSCGSDKLTIDVRKVSDFASADTSAPILNGQLNLTPSYDPGGPGCIIVVRVMYQWPTYVSIYGLSARLANMSGNKRLLMSTAVFRNEPYSNGTAGSC
jgi:Flp pilus assembly protein TadG